MIKPVNEFIILKQKEKKSSFITSVEVEKLQNEFEVIAISSEVFFDTFLSIGDTVIKGQYSGDEIKVDGETFFVVKKEHILAIKE